MRFLMTMFALHTECFAAVPQAHKIDVDGRLIALSTNMLICRFPLANQAARQRKSQVILTEQSEGKIHPD